MEHYTEYIPGATLVIDKEKYRYFGGTAYLGLQADPDFQELFIANVRNYGTAYGASRKSNVRLTIYDKAERFLADWTGSESSVTMSSGYLAGQLVANQFSTPQYKVFYAPNCHPALFCSTGGSMQPKPYVTYTSLEIALRQHLELKNGVTAVVFLDAIDFSGTNYPKFEGIKSLPLEDIILVADDSHGIGLVGPGGAGVYPLLAQLEAKELVVCCSLGKALGIQAGAIFCSGLRYKSLTSTEFFAGASPAAPAYLATLLQARDLIQRKRIQLSENISIFTSGIKDLHKLNSIANYPVFSATGPKLNSFLFENNVIVTHFSYPNEASPDSSRIVLNARHKREDLEYLVNLLHHFFLKN